MLCGIPGIGLGIVYRCVEVEGMGLEVLALAKENRGWGGRWAVGGLARSPLLAADFGGWLLPAQQ